MHQIQINVLDVVALVNIILDDGEYNDTGDLNFDNSSDVGSWSRPTYYIGTTFIYQGEQESQVFDISAGGNRSINDDNILNAGSALS